MTEQKDHLQLRTEAKEESVHYLRELRKISRAFFITGNITLGEDLTIIVDGMDIAFEKMTDAHNTLFNDVYRNNVSMFGETLEKIVARSIGIDDEVKR